jgi:hypothetical protein
MGIVPVKCHAVFAGDVRAERLGDLHGERAVRISASRRSGARVCSVNWKCWRCKLPEVQSPDDPDRAEVVALRAAIRELITEITIGLADPT